LVALESASPLSSICSPGPFQLLLPECSARTGESSIVNGEQDSTKPILRDFVNATVGFEGLAKKIHKPTKSLHRMLSPRTPGHRLLGFPALKQRVETASTAQWSTSSA